MKVYLADSVKIALEKMEKRSNRACKGLDDLVCPATHLLLESDGGGVRKCNDAPPDKCSNARKRDCKRIVFIYNDKAKTRLYCMLPLYFTISDKSRMGFIDSEDNQLNALIKKQDIYVEDLESLDI
jgi:hypothetical protein